MMPKPPGIKLGKTSLLHPAPVTVWEVVSPLLQSSQLCCLVQPLLLLRLSSWGSLLTGSRWVCGATPLGAFDVIGFGLGREVCAPDPPLWSVFLGGAVLARRKPEIPKSLSTKPGLQAGVNSARSVGRIGAGAWSLAALPKPRRLTKARACPSSHLPALVQVQLSRPSGSAVTFCLWHCAREGISLPRPPWEEPLLHACSWAYSCCADGALGARPVPILDPS